MREKGNVVILIEVKIMDSDSSDVVKIIIKLGVPFLLESYVIDFIALFTLVMNVVYLYSKK